MIITTARKPSSKIRTFCKHLGRFTGCEYVPRGKTSLKELIDQTLLVVGEHRGNPGNFSFFSEGKCVLSIRANVSLEKDINPGREPVIKGDSELARVLSKLTGFRIGVTGERMIRVNERIEFLNKDTIYIALHVIGIRGEGIV
jgi:rRNA maturation protein Rpf1